MKPTDEPHIRQLIDGLAPADAHLVVAGLKGSAPAYLLSRLLGETRHTLLIVTPDGDTADELHRELRCFTPDVAVNLFPAWETVPFEAASPHPDIAGRRLETLSRLLDGRVRALVAPAEALLQRVLPRRLLGEVAQYLVTGEEVAREQLLARLGRLGYGAVPLVEDRGTFAVRGGILDIFPPGLPQPVRIEFFGDFIETIRVFDPLTQRSLHPLDELVLLPSREVILDETVLTAFQKRLKNRCDLLELPPDRRRAMLEELQHAIYPPGVEYLQPLFHPGLETLLDYAGPQAIRVVLDPAALERTCQDFAGEMAAAVEQARLRDQITCEPAELYLGTGEVAELLAAGRRLELPGLELAGGGEALRLHVEGNQDLRLEVKPDSSAVLRPLVERFRWWLDEGRRIILVCHQQGQAERLGELLEPYGLPLTLSTRQFPAERVHRDGRVTVIIGDISRGFRFAEEGLVLIAEEELFGRRMRRRDISEVRKRQILTSLAELKPGDLMVHVDFGVGIYRGLQHLRLGNVEGDFLLLEYAGADKLYLPVDRIGLVQRYVGSEGVEPRIDRLGGAGWEKAKARARAAVQEMAEELLRIYASRQVEEGHAFSPRDEDYREFEASFAYEETPDQQAAIEDVLADMEKSRPMDRLVCGDVGYGKTEVAIRAAFKAAMEGKQVAVLVPTTVLAQQHLETFRGRFANYPIAVEALSRFRSAKEQKGVLEGVKKGEVDVVIGTHRLLQSDVQFRDLGLLIIDEEHRFGVAHKERLKKFRALVDVLTLTATPIPRTLYMSMMGVRDLSIIDTPPADRLAVRTFVARFSDEIIREAVLRELRRGGQVFFVHNRVQTIGAMEDYLRRIVPEARIVVGHGQMEEGELEKVMLGFMHGESNLLLCTTIIESGLDIPNANTLIVNRADTFGLAQLYQLRGRVGRSRQRAFAYFLIPGEGAITGEARERLRIIQDLAELGAGFRIASHDLELRGAGDLLGAKQSGQIAAVGFELYTELLEETIRTMKGEELPERVEPELKLQIPAFIPEEYVPNPNQRLVIYKKLTQAGNEEEIAELAAELQDRFGKLPPAAGYLLEIMRLRLQLKALLIKEVEWTGRQLIFSFHQKTQVSPDIIIALIRREPKRFQFTPDFRLIVEVADRTFEGLLTSARNCLKSLG